MTRFESLLVVVTLLVAAPALAFEGRLVSDAGRPLAGAHVEVLGGRGMAVADTDGRFTLEPTPRTPFTVLVTRPDGVLIQPVTVEAIPSDGPVVVRVAPARTESVTVIGAPPDLELPPASALTVLGGGDLRQRDPGQLTEVLEGVPGASANGGGHTAVPALRGLAMSRTLILLDDGRVTAERRAGPSATFVDPASIEEVEIVRGPGSVAYGSDAFGGLIRLRTRIPGPGEPTTARCGLTIGSNGDERAVDSEVDTTLFGGGFLLGASYRKLDDYSSPEGETALSGFESRGFRTGYQHDIGPGMLRVLWRTDLGRDAGKAATDSATKPTSYPEEDSDRLTVAYEQPGPGSWSRVGASLFWDEYRLLTRADTLATPSKPRSLSEADVFAHDYGLRLEAERPIGSTRFLLGLDGAGRYGLHAVNRITTFDAVDQPVEALFESSIDRADKNDVGVFASLEASAGRVGLAGGLRLDWVETSNRSGYFGDLSTSRSDVSGFVGATVPLGAGLELSGQLARGFRDALLSDRYYRGVSGRGFITGNPDLDPETSLQTDLALRYSSGPLRLAGYGYAYRIRNLIERYRDDEGDYQFRNRGRAELHGAELEASMGVGAGLLAQLAIQYETGKARDDSSRLDSIPPTAVIVTVRGDPSRRWWWLARAGAYARVDRPGPNEKVVPGFTVADAAVGVRLSDLLELELLGRNLLDRAYYPSADEKTVLAPGRSVELRLRLLPTRLQ